MAAQKINGDRSLAWGAIEAGISMVTGYPGSPGTGTFNALAETAWDYGHHAEWCINERIALDVAAGASQGGKRALVCIKSVGMNVALDTLMVLNMTGVYAGLVILMGDDPGAWGSQNEQDTRALGPPGRTPPCSKPATPGEGRQMVRFAFDLSESLRTVVHHPHYPQLQHARGRPLPTLAPPDQTRPPAGQATDALGIFPAQTASPTTTASTRPSGSSQTGSAACRSTGSKARAPGGILAGGFVYTKLKEALAGADTSNLCILKLSALYPLPGDLIAQFLKTCHEVLVLEEVDPYLEDAVKTVGYDIGATPGILGKRTGHVNWEGETLPLAHPEGLRRLHPGLFSRPALHPSRMGKGKALPQSLLRGVPLP